MKLGYARVSTAEQHLTMQLDLLRQANCERLFQEKHSGAVRDREVLGRLLEQLRAGDTVVVWRLDRLARSTRDLLEIVEHRARALVDEGHGARLHADHRRGPGRCLSGFVCG